MSVWTALKITPTDISCNPSHKPYYKVASTSTKRQTKYAAVQHHHINIGPSNAHSCVRGARSMVFWSSQMCAL